MTIKEKACEVISRMPEDCHCERSEAISNETGACYNHTERDCHGPSGLGSRKAGSLAMTCRTALLRKVLVLVILWVNVFLGSACFAELKGGVGKVNITPPLGGLLIGSKGYVSDDVLDELYAKALVLNDGNHTVAIVACDLLYTPLEEITGPVRRIVKEKTGIPEDNVMVCATHTHSGPEVYRRSKFASGDKAPAISEVDRSYMATLVGKIASAVLLAHKDVQDVQIGAAKGRAPKVVYNRRPTNDNGLVQMAFTLPEEVRATRKVAVDDDGLTRVTFTFANKQGPLRFGPVDPAVRVLRVEDANGVMVGSLVNFGCHPVCIYPYLSTSISADYPAYVRRVVEQGEGGLCLFTLGLAGNTVPFHRGVVPRRQVGRAVGGEALKQLQFLPTCGDVTLDAATKEISLPARKPSTKEEAESSDWPDHIPTELQVLRLGDIYLLGLPGEILVEVGMEIQKRAGLENLIIVTICNDAVGYVCHGAAYDEGGYEPSANKLAKGAGEIMIERALELIEQIKQER